MRTREELVGKKFVHGSIADPVYTFTKIKNGRIGLTWADSNGKPSDMTWNAQEAVNLINSGTWNLIEEEPEFKVSTIYTDSAESPPHSIEYIITGINRELVSLSWFSPNRDRQDFAEISKTVIKERIKEGRFKFVTKESKMNNSTIEVGDKVIYRSGAKMKDYNKLGNPVVAYKVVERVNGTVVIYVGGGWDNAENLTVVEKAGELVGYELLKDMPNVKAGTVSNCVNGGWYGFALTRPHGAAVNYSVHEDELKDNTWFKPVYKPKELIIKISSNRNVLIENNKATIKGVDSMSFIEIKFLYDTLNPTNKLGKHQVVIPQDTKIRVGCQEFTKQDINTVYNAVKDAR